MLSRRAFKETIMRAAAVVVALLCCQEAAGKSSLAPRGSRKAVAVRRGGFSSGGFASARKAPASELLSPKETLIAGACARVVAQTILHPLDVVRTRTQAKSLGTSTLRESLFFGMIPQVMLSAPAGAVQFSAVRFCRKKVESVLPEEFVASQQGRFFTQLFAAAGGASCAGLIRIPQEVVKQGCMVELYPHAFAAVTTIAKTKGLAGFYKGAVATLSRDVLWNSLSFSIFRLLLDIIRSKDPQVQYVLGIVAGCSAACATHPLDVAKTRVMTSQAAVKGSLLDQLANLVKDEGWPVLFSGLAPRLFYLGPLASLVLATNEVIAAILIKARTL